MSKYMKLSCQVADKSVLLASLTEMGLQYLEHNTPVTIKGYGSYTEKAEIVVTKESLAKSGLRSYGDLGFSWNSSKNEFDIIIDDMGANVKNALLSKYREKAIEKAFSSKGYKFTKTKVDNKTRMIATCII